MVYHKPFKVNLQFTEKDTPGTYLSTLPMGVSLGKTMKVLRIQDTNNQVGKAGAVAPGVTAEYPGEAETITLGFSPGKAYDSVGIGRHGNFMLWGWSAPPAKMTEAGRQLFLNCICYMHQYDRKPFVRIPQRARARTMVDTYFDRMAMRADIAESYLKYYFPPELAQKYKQDPEGTRQYYEENIELVYAAQRKFRIDEDLKSLGIRSNRNLAMLKTLIDLLKDTSKAELAQTCLARYTNQSFKSPQAWQDWYEKNADHLIFSDIGDYCFYSIASLE